MYMSVDRDRICQVLINLLSNAIKYSPEGGAVKVTCERSYHEIKLNVCDQGRGIPSQLKDKIFDRFVQVEKADATERGGTGLGLAIARAIVEQHGGTIGVDSVQDIGSTFWFTIPTAEGLRQRLAESASDAVRADSP
jgi:signal transduction histidine kinase